MLSDDQLVKIRVIRNVTNRYLVLKGRDPILYQVAKLANSVVREEMMCRKQCSSSLKEKEGVKCG
jgi:hypothetical protein